MPPVDPAVLAERLAALERHLRRVADSLPAEPEGLPPDSSASDTVILHLWLAVQLTVDLAVSWAVRAGLGVPPTHGDSFRMLARSGLIDTELAQRLVAAAGFRTLIVHPYADPDLRRVHRAAQTGPADLRAFVAALLANEGLVPCVIRSGGR